MKRFILPLFAMACLIASCGEKNGADSRSGIEYLTLKVAGISDNITSTINNETRRITLSRHVSEGTQVTFSFRAYGTVCYNGSIIVSETNSINFQKSLELSVKSPDRNIINYQFEVPEQDVGNNNMTAFALQFTQGGLPSKCSGTINDRDGTITVIVPETGWIDNIRNATAMFSSTGASVIVDGQEQTSDVSENNYMTDIVYTVIAGNGDRRDYTVTVVSPQSTGLPVVHIETQGGAAITNKEDYIVSRVSIHDAANSSNNIDEVTAGVRGRGNTTWSYDKKPYRIKLDKKASVFGLEAAKNWVLLANWQDPTFMMNTVAFELSRRLGMAFTPTPTHVELFLNGAYKGSYVLCEHMQVADGCVEIDEFDDVLLELDSYFDEDNKFESDAIKMPVMIKSPEFEGMTTEEREAAIKAIKADYERMEEAVMAMSGWKEYMDAASFINYLIVYEITRNTELEWPKSTYLHKKAGEKWVWGPVWDFDWAYGYTGGGQNYWSSGTASSVLYNGNSDNRPGSIFFNKLFNDDGFKKEYQARWNEIMPLISDIDEFAGEMGTYLAKSDFQNKKIWGNQYAKNYTGQVESMQAWLRQRIAYLDGIIANY